MIFRRLFDDDSGTCTYLLGSAGQALLIDPVRDRAEQYLVLLGELGLQLSAVLETHTHADHVSAMADLRDRTGCRTVMGIQAQVVGVTDRLRDNQVLDWNGPELRAWYTPGHTDDSYCYIMADRVFTGDCLLIRGSGRTDFQNGDALQGWTSLQRLMMLPDETLVYPGHDYKGWSVSTIDEERRCNPRLQVADAAAYAALMAGLDLPDPKAMDVAVPANLAGGRVVGHYDGGSGI